MKGNSDKAMRLWKAGAARGSEECILQCATALRLTDPSAAFQAFKSLADTKKNVIAQVNSFYFILVVIYITESKFRFLCHSVHGRCDVY